MSVAGLVVLAALAALVLLVVLWPFVRPLPETQRRMLDRQRERALAYYERALINVRDLDEDFATGKISEEEYRAERELWASRGARVLQFLDELDHQRPIIDDVSADDAQIDAVIEEAIRSVRVAHQGGTA
jgi:hypothetical protein